MTRPRARKRAPVRVPFRCGALVAGAAVVAACTKVGTDPRAAVAIELLPPPVPSVVTGDVLRDSTGQPATLRALAFNSRDEVIPDAPVRFLVIDPVSVIQLDSITGAVTAGSDTGQVRVVASVGGLQATPVTVTVVPPPDTLFSLDSTSDTLEYTIGGSAQRTLRVQLGNRTLAAGAVLPVRSYIVRYAFENPPGMNNTDTTNVLLVNDAGRPSLVDTTDASGVASRALQVAPFTTTFPPTVGIRVDAFRYDAPSVPLAGSPLHFVITLKAS